MDISDDTLARAALPEILLTSDLALAFRASQATIRRWIRQGALPATRIGRRYIVRRDDLLAVLTPNARRRLSVHAAVRWGTHCAQCGQAIAEVGGLTVDDSPLCRRCASPDDHPTAPGGTK
jgi:excisionase family DNA binding protein